MSQQDFTPANLPFGVADDRAHVAIGDRAVDLAAAAGLFDVDPTLFEGPLNRLASGAWRAVRDRVAELLPRGDLDAFLVDIDDLTMQLPVAIGDYVDGYAGLHHATNLGRILRPGTEPLNANWRHLPVMYHGRAGTVVVSGTEIRRPRGQVLVDGVPQLKATERLDIELELGAIVGSGNAIGEPIDVEDAADHLFGYVLVNDWSARDIQSFEYVPLGPFLGKSFATSISPWVVTVDALRPHLVAGLAARQEPEPLPYLQGDPRVPDLTFTVERNGEVISEVDLAESIYWTAAQQLAHVTVNGASTRSGDLIASGTISGPDTTTQAGSLIERGLSPSGSLSGEPRFLVDGDEIVLRGWVGEGEQRVGFGPLAGRIGPAS